MAKIAPASPPRRDCWGCSNRHGHRDAIFLVRLGDEQDHASTGAIIGSDTDKTGRQAIAGNPSKCLSSVMGYSRTRTPVAL